MLKLRTSTVTTVIFFLLVKFNTFNGTVSGTHGLECPSEHFPCENAYRCLAVSHMCDGINDCGDNSDEYFTNCLRYKMASHFTSCEDDRFECNNHNCIDPDHVCDGDNDCGDYTDERQPYCDPSNHQPITTTPPTHCSNSAHIQCDNGRCINSLFVCDGDNDCGDNTDEQPPHCQTTTTVAPSSSSEEFTPCEDDEFRCNNLKCISYRYVCDGDNDCGDNTDEQPPHCHRTTTEAPTASPEGSTSCEDGYFQCNNQRCIPTFYVCDGDNDCGDLTDEQPPSCQISTTAVPSTTTTTAPPARLEDAISCEDDFFECDKQNWIPPSNGDLTNEQSRYFQALCRSRGGFLCKNERCIDHYRVCNGDDDCGDNTDERLPLCDRPIFRLTTTTTTRTASCSDLGRFLCKNGRCIRRLYVCHGVNNCGDDTDEQSSHCQSSTTAAPTTTRSPPSCTDLGGFLCNNQKCIDLSRACNGHNDCGDLTDEQPPYCTHPTTEPTTTTTSPPSSCSDSGEFQCNNGRCIRRAYVCDDDNDCGDYTDERPPYCNVPTTQPTTTAPPPSCTDRDEFVCNNGRCIQSSYVCDGDNDCGDDTDEGPPYCIRTNTQPTTTTTRSPPPCPDHAEFRCNNGGCIRRAYVCDGDGDCEDGTDESAPHC